MKVNDAVKSAEVRESGYRRTIARGRKVLNRRVPPQPARDDRGAQKAWRPGDR